MSKRKPLSQSSVRSTLPADPSLWSEKSKQSVAFSFVQDYTDIPYKCRHCQAECVFTAEDQKYTFETKKASIDQRRKFCTKCWLVTHRIREELQANEERWVESKTSLQTNKEFLGGWLELLIQLEEYVPYKPDTAKKNMLRKLLENASQAS